MHRQNGRALDGIDHVRQSVADILTTPIGSRVARREYGSHLLDLIDQPLTPAAILRLYAATALALSRHEDRLRLTRVTVAPGATRGAAALTIEATLKLAPAAASTPQTFVVPLSILT